VIGLCGVAALGILSSRAAEADTVKEGAGKASSGKAGTIENSVVKVFSTMRYPDFYKPWTKQTPNEASGTGVVIEKKRILSNAHVVLYASQVQVQANQAGDKFSATVEYIAPEVDLAVLKLDDESFFDSHPPLSRASELPDIKDAVMAYGYPSGGNSLSITKGIVSRIEFARSLWIQIDAAINPGNSGGPAVVNDKMIGLAFSRLGGADNIGYIIPCEEIELFLQDVADGDYRGKPAMFDELQTLENPALRPFLKLEKSVEGIIVHKPEGSDEAYPLKEWDVITRIGDTRVDNMGMVTLNANVRVRFQYMIQKLAKHGKVPLTVVRAGKEKQIELPVPAKQPTLLPVLNGTYPSYFVYGPLAFSTATSEMVAGVTRGERASSWSSWLMSAGSPLVRRMGDKPEFEGENLVFVSSPFFPHKLAKGYSQPGMQVVKSINGRAVKNLGHLVELLRDSKDEFITIAFDMRGGETVVFSRAEMVAATDDILTDNGVRSQGSADMMAIWNGKRGK
jgi:S1-C subfamily serine protease